MYETWRHIIGAHRKHKEKDQPYMNYLLKNLSQLILLCSSAMADQKVTKMVMKVDLQCYKCYRKIKKVLCSCPKIRDQVFDEKQNTVTITVVCCSPEKIMEKITCKAGDTVESIEILPDKPKEPEKKKEPEKAKEPEKPKPVEKAKEHEKPKPVEQPKPAEKPMEPEKPKPAEKPKEPEKPKPAEPEKPKEPPKPEKPKVVFVEPPKEAAKLPVQAPAPASAPSPAAKAPAPAPALPPTLPEPIVQGFPQLTPTGPVPMYPVAMCCCCHEGGPCYHGFGRPSTWYDGYVQPAYELPDRNRGYYVNRCDYFSDENASGCSIM